MKNWLGTSLALAWLCGSLGCSLCANPFDHDYVTYGSRTPRTDMRHGRVGSPFSDPAMNGAPSKAVEAIDESYSEVLEGADDTGPIFMDEPMSEPDLFDETP